MGKYVTTTVKVELIKRYIDQMLGSVISLTFLYVVSHRLLCNTLTKLLHRETAPSVYSHYLFH